MGLETIMKYFRIIFSLLCLAEVSAQVDSSNVDVNALPNTAEGFGINIVVREPYFINPAALAFDAKGRLFVGAGPQYRKPNRDTPGDYIKILVDNDEGGVAEEVKTFADGSPRDIPTGNIQKHTILEISGMPPSYAFSLSTQEVADISAWLIDQRTTINKK